MDYVIHFIGNGVANLESLDRPDRPAKGYVLGKTLYSLISPGTELQMGYLDEHDQPITTGYASVLQVQQVHDSVTSVKTGDIVFCMYNHQSFQHVPASEIVKIPENLDPSIAVIARLLNIPMTTLYTTKSKPGDKVLVTGAGPVGLLSALLFQNCGYEVTLCDPDKNRLKKALEAGIKKVSEVIPIYEETLKNTFALVLECSGNESAVLEGCNMVHKGGEVVLIGVPWKRYTDFSAHELCSLVFHNYVQLRSGWEWELPRFDQDFQPRSIQSNLEIGMRWLESGSFNLNTLVKKVSPKDAQQIYSGLLNREFDELFIMFDWECLEGGN
jgi:threonine dehydrogenase-like Zn-dependent dehydrogenase